MLILSMPLARCSKVVALVALLSVGIPAHAQNHAPVLNPIANRSVSVCQQVILTATASDPESQTLAFGLVNPPAGATINSSSGAFSWTPTATGAFTIRVKVSDNGTPSLSATNSFSITVTNVAGGNRAPVLAAIGNKAVREESTLRFTATATDSNAGQTLTYSLIAPPPGAAINAQTGVFTWTPTEAQGPGTYTFKVMVSDNGSPMLWDEEQIRVTVNEFNRAPSITAIPSKSVPVCQLLTFVATASDSDLPTQRLSWALVNPPTGATINTNTGAFSWTPTAAGNFTVRVKVTDNGAPALSVTNTVSISVTNRIGNMPPVLAPIGNKTNAEEATLSFTARATDTNSGQSLTFSLLGAPSGATINSASGVFAWTPTEGQGPGTYPICVRVTDSGSPSLWDEELVNVTVREVNRPPTLAAISNKTVGTYQTLAFTVSATDRDLPGQSLRYSLINPPSGATVLTNSGAFTWVPRTAGTFTVRLAVKDNGTPVAGVTNTFTVVVTNTPAGNRPPVLAAISNRTINEEVTLSFTNSATDPNAGQVLSYNLVSAPTGATINSTNGVFTWTPTEAQGPAVYSFKVRVADNGSPVCTDEKSVTVTVNEVNRAPVLAGLPNRSIGANQTVSFTATATDTDSPAQLLTYSLVSSPVGASINPVSGAFSWIPTMAGTFPITIQVSDNGTPSLTAQSTFSIVVSAGNRAPVLGSVGNKTVSEMTTLSFTATASDPDAGQALTYSLVNAPVGASINPTSGNFTWTPTESQGPSTNTFSIRVTDNASSPQSDEEQITVVVTEVNRAPSLSIPNKSIGANQTLAFTAAASDPDQPAQSLTYSLVAPPAGAAITTSGYFTWTPTSVGTYSVSVKVTDNGSPILGYTNTFSVNVTNAPAGNRAPVLNTIGNKTVSEMTTLSFTATATDPDAGQSLTFSLLNQPSGASISSSGSFSWTPTEAQGPGQYTFTVRVTDNGTPQQIDEEQITVTVSEVNRAPSLNTIANRSVGVNQAVSFSASASDPDQPAQTLTFSLTNSPAGASINPASGAFSWTPSATGSFAVTVKVTDNGSPALSASQTLTITVTNAATRLEFLPTFDNRMVYCTWTNWANTVYANSDLAVGINWIWDVIAGQNWLIYQSAIWFDIQSQIANRQIRSAKLQLWVNQLPADVNTIYKCAAFAGPWDQSTITFNNKPTQIYTDGIVSVSPPTSATVPVEWDVTTIVRNWANGTSGNFGFFLWDPNEVAPGLAYRATGFHSMNSYNNVSQRPRLIVEFQ